MSQNNKRSVVILLALFILVQTIFFTVQSAPPSEPQIYETTLESDTSVYVSETQPTTNFDTGTNKYYLYVYQDEFEYQMVSFVKFDLSSLPDDADVFDAEIRLYLTDDPDTSVIVNMYPILGDWSESTVTWNTKPSYSGLISGLNINTDGWKEWDATSVVEDWVDGIRNNYGVAFVTQGSIPRFRSDDSSYEPRLWILYQSSSGEEPENPPEDPPEDTTPCEITYTVSPENPQSGDEVTIYATATDNIGLEYITILEGLLVELCSSFAEDDTTTELTCEYSEVLYTPGKTFYIEANDKGSSETQLIEVDIDVAGSGSDPVVTLDIAFDDDDVIPSKYRLLPMDGQTVEITATATDPDGIDMMTITYDGTPYDYMYDPAETEVEETLYLINGADFLEDCSPPCTFRYSVRAYDTEGRSTRVEGDDIEVNAPWQWYWGLPFANWGCDENHTWRWSMMESIYGDEVWWNKDRGWAMPHALYIYDNQVKTGGRGGQCYGMCVTALELAQSSPRIYANLVQPSAVTIDDLERENWFNTWRYYYARQEGQYSWDIMTARVAQYLLQPEYSGSGLHPFIDHILDGIIADLNAGTPGILGIRGDGGHAVVPWRVKQVGSNRYHVYIYDPNHAHTSTHNSTDFDNFEHYPYIDFGDSGWSRNGWWSYEWNSSSTWNHNIYYYPYDMVIGNPSSINYIGSLTSGTTPITDQRLPDPIQALACGSGDAMFYAEDSAGRKTGYVNGDLVVEIPYSVPIFEFAGNDDIVDMFMLPSNVTLTYHMESTVDSEGEMGEYSLMVWANNSCYFLENMTCTKDTEDELSLTPRLIRGADLSHTLRFHRGDVTGIRANDPMDYSITFVNEFYNSPFVGRIYKFTTNQNEEGAEVELYVSEDHDELMIETFEKPFSFSVTTKSTESFEDDPNIDYIPESTGDFTMDANSKMVLSPENWKTTDASGTISSGSYQQKDTNTSNGNKNDESTQTPGFEVCLFIITLALILGYKKRKK